MRRHASHSLWPHFALLVCLFFLSLCATRAWYDAGQERADRGRPHSRERNSTPPDHRPVDWTGELDLAPPSIESAPEKRNRFASVIAAVDEVATFFSAARPGNLVKAVANATAAQQVERPQDTAPGIRPSGTISATERQEHSSRSSILPPVEVATEESGIAKSSSSDDRDGGSKALRAERHGPDAAAGPVVCVSDEGDRLAVRPRLFPRRKSIVVAESEPDTPLAVAPDGLKWLQVEPTSLLRDLDELEATASPPVSEWAAGTRTTIQRLNSTLPQDRADHSATLSNLLQSGERASRLAEQLPPGEREAFERVRSAVIRRAAVWAALGEVGIRPGEWKAAGNRLRQSVSGLRSGIQGAPQAEDWEKYLLLDDVLAAWDDEPERDDKRVRHLIERLSDRLDNPDLTPAQRALLATGAFAAFRRDFGDWAAAIVDLEILCKAIEAHESRGGELYATRIAADTRLLALASRPEVRRAAETIDRYYRGANLRLAVSAKLLQRMIPEQPLVAEPVRDTIAGASVAGRSLTETDVRVVLVPDPRNWRIGLRVTGGVSASTSSTSGPATFHSAARTEYVARKLVVLTPAGLYSFPAVAGAEADNMLRAIDTSFDGIPLIEGLVRSIVLGQHEKSRRQAMAEVESKVSYKARQRLDAELDERLHDVAGRVRRNVLNPLVGLDLRPQTVELATSSERLTTQVRLAAPRQLGAHTPRPLALSDSLLSVQMHQSVLNNFLEQLELAGRKMTLPELYAEVATKLGRDLKVPDDLSRTASIHFARNDPVALSIKDGRVRVTLSLREVKDGRHSFHNFKVHAYYRPEADGLRARLVRDGIIEIEGRALPTGEYMVLQGVFVGLFSDSRPFSLVDDERSRDSRLAGLMITQLVLHDGWIGLALGPSHPHRSALMTRTVR